MKNYVNLIMLMIVFNGGIGMSELKYKHLSLHRQIMHYSKDVIKKVWERAIPVMNQDPAHVQKDECGAWIVFEAYGDRNNEYGWEIDHIIPISNGGTDDLSNLQPLHWDNNVAKGDGVLVCKVVANGIHNKIDSHWNILFE